MRKIYGRLLKALPALALGIVLSACSSDEGGDTTPTVYEDPVFNPVAIDNITHSSMALDGGVYSLRNHRSVLEKGFVYSVFENPTITQGDKIQVTDGTSDSFSTTISGLSSETTYYVRAYIRSGSNNTYYYSDQESAATTETPSAVINDISTGTIASHTIEVSTSFSATNLTAEEKGFIYSSTEHNPTLGAAGVDKIEDASPGLNIAATLSGLGGNTLYYIRAYVIDDDSRTFYSTVKTATTL